MDLITTHVNADFDALGSCIAARRLYPGARIMLPGSQEEAVRELLHLVKELVTVETERECRLDDVDRLILVDTRHKSRIGRAGELVGRGVEIHIYDHHPRMKGDIVADREVYEEVGSTITMLTEIIRRRRIRLSHLEATIMLLGIYEETNSLTYRSTTKQDVDAVSYLLSRGANLSMVSSYLNRELGKGELALLIRLINSTERIKIKGVSISLIEIDKSEYVPELSMLIQKLIDIENIPVLFVLVDSDKRIDIIGRSNIQALDVNSVLSKFGGGGHPGAASAKIRGIGLKLARQRLLRVISKAIRLRMRAADIMSRGPVFANPDSKVSDVKKVLLDRSLPGVPVVERGRVVGIITMEGLNKAIKRSFGHSRIKGYMTIPAITVSPTTPRHGISSLVIDRDIGVIPVLKGKKMVGVISRTQVLKSLHGSLFSSSRAPRKQLMTNLSRKMSAILPDDTMVLLRRIGKMADSFGYSAFVVGGMVRDLILGASNLDMDIVVEGEALKLGAVLAEELGASLVVHRKFGTCTVVTADKRKIDLATARKEVYERPAALPTVEFSSLKDDLIRRDFTINAMAVSINPAGFGQLIDFFGGVRDLEHGRIRVMHEASFIDDPTRIFRAVRFEQRFGFLIDNHTEGLIRQAIKEEMFEKVHPQRIRDEAILILREEDPLRALKRMAELDELRFLHPDIILNSRLIKLYGSIEAVTHWYSELKPARREIEKWLIYIMALFEDLSYNTVSRICGKYAFRRGESIRILSYKGCAGRVERALRSPRQMAPSRVYGVLAPLSYEVILLIMARIRSRPGSSKDVAIDRIKAFLEVFCFVKIHINGSDLRNMGLRPSPEYKGILDKILCEKLDGKAATREEELKIANRLAGLCG